VLALNSRCLRNPLNVGSFIDRFFDSTDLADPAPASGEWLELFRVRWSLRIRTAMQVVSWSLQDCTIRQNELESNYP
jgi:hypothetical protein